MTSRNPFSVGSFHKRTTHDSAKRSILARSYDTSYRVFEFNFTLLIMSRDRLNIAEEK